MVSFSDFNLNPVLLKALARMNYTEPTPVQAEVIPLIQQGRDLIALAQTGSGKTAACAIPICNKVDTGSKGIQTLIVVPTRELALQYVTEVDNIGRSLGVKAFAILGGEDMGTQQAKLQAGVHVLVATPGRLIDFIYSRSIDLSHVTTLVLDEADEMLSMGFYADLEFIIQCLVQKHQTLLFSATMPETIRRIARSHMREPLEVALNQSQTTPQHLEHRFVYCRHHDREHRLVELLQEMQPDQCLIFSQSRHHCETLCRQLQRHFDRVDFLHAGLEQEVRSIITNKFRQGKIRYLVATDVASRGLDFSHVTHVFMYQLAPDPEVYIHRAGRTGRCSRVGTSVALITDREMPLLHRVLQLLKCEPVWIGHPPAVPAAEATPRGSRRPQRRSAHVGAAKSPRHERRERPI